MPTGVLPGCEVSGALLRDTLGRLDRFLQGYVQYFPRRDTAANGALVVKGLLSGIERKSVEPIAELHGVKRRKLQKFMGESPWDDDLVGQGIRSHVGAAWGEPNALLVIDPTTFPKQGKDSVGVERQWCGRLGKVENCQKGVFIAYATSRGTTLVDRRLYLPEDWAKSRRRRKKCHVPTDVKFAKSWEIAADLLEHCKALPHAFVVGDDEFGRASELRDRLATRNERYVFDVPSNILVRQRGGDWMRVSDWAKSKGKGSWYRCHIRDGSRKPMFMFVISAEVQTKRDQRVGPWERVIVMKTIERKPEWFYALSNAPREVKLGDLVRAARGRHGIEEGFGEAKGQVGLAHYELRSWIGWHHHMTLSMLALWFLQLEREHLGGKKPGHYGSSDRICDQGTPPSAQADRRRTRHEDRTQAVAKRGRARWPVSARWT